MYKKYFISRNLPTYDSNLLSSIRFFPINFYYISKTTTIDREGEKNKLLDDLKIFLSDYQKKNSELCYLTYGNPSSTDYNTINNLQKYNTN